MVAIARCAGGFEDVAMLHRHNKDLTIYLEEQLFQAEGLNHFHSLTPCAEILQKLKIFATAGATRPHRSWMASRTWLRVEKLPVDRFTEVGTVHSGYLWYIKD